MRPTRADETDAMIDWGRLKPYRSDKRKSFEELCYQLAKAEYGATGTFTSIDDSGGGDGVEFYLTLPTGEEWGWQAKFYYPGQRLDNSRKRGIEDSLTRTLEKHPNIEKWFLCTPGDLTIAEHKWVAALRRRMAPNMEFVLWGDRHFNDAMSLPANTGKRMYFFGELELAMFQEINTCTPYSGLRRRLRNIPVWASNTPSLKG